MTEEKYIINIAAGTSQIPVITAAKNMGYKIIAIDKDVKASGLKWVDIHLPISTHETEKVVKALTPLYLKYDVSGIVCRSTGKALLTTANIAQKFKLPSLSKDIVLIATEKSELRNFCNANQIKTIRGRKVGPEDDIDSIKSKLKLPLIVKPDYTVVGKKDITIISKYSDLAGSIKSACKSSANGLAEIEEYVEGFDVTSLFLLKTGYAKTITIVDELVGVQNSGHVIGLGVSVPSVISNSSVEKKIIQTIDLFASNFKNATALLQLCFRIDMNGAPHVIELHADLGGKEFEDIVSSKTTTNFNYFDLSIQVATNQRVNLKPLKFKPTCLLSDMSRFSSQIVSDSEIYGDSLVLQKDSLISNLTHASHILRKSPKITLAKLPTHKNWLEK